MIDELLEEMELSMELSVEALQTDYAAMRTGRASTGVVSKVMVNYHGMPVALQELALLSIPEPQLIAIRPHDPSAMTNIEKAIMEADLGMTPNNDGQIIRLQVPTLTDERRRDLAKAANKRAEEARISVRNARRDVLNKLKAAEKNKDITEDDHHEARDNVQKLTDRYVQQIDQMLQTKEKDLAVA